MHLITTASVEFQSTLPRRKRQNNEFIGEKTAAISIHASAKEATLSKSKKHVEKNISIHASAKEATHELGHALLHRKISIHASAKEATSGNGNKGSRQHISIHASAKEATVSGRTFCPMPRFQSTLPRRKRLCRFPFLASNTGKFQSTLPRRKRLSCIMEDILFM